MIKYAIILLEKRKEVKTMNILMMIFLRVLSVYLAMAIFNMINLKRAFDVVYGKSPMNWKKLRTLVRNVTCVPVKFFLMDWWFGLINPNTIVKAVAQQRKITKS